MNDRQVEALADCPFCGGSRLKQGGDDKFVGVACLDCEATGPNHYRTGCDWNIRSRTAPDVAMREALDEIWCLREVIRGVRIMQNAGAFKEYEGEPWLKRVQNINIDVGFDRASGEPEKHGRKWTGPGYLEQTGYIDAPTPPDVARELRPCIETLKPFMAKPVGGEGSPARRDQEERIAAYSEAIALLSGHLKRTYDTPLVWMMPEHIASYQAGQKDGIAWANYEKTESYTIPLYLHPTREAVAREIEQAQATLDAYKDAMACQNKNASDAKLIVMANYGDLCAAHLSCLIKVLAPAQEGE